MSTSGGRPGDIHVTNDEPEIVAVSNIALPHQPSLRLLPCHVYECDHKNELFYLHPPQSIICMSLSVLTPSLPFSESHTYIPMCAVAFPLATVCELDKVALRN
jgi:hypothetical protein